MKNFFLLLIALLLIRMTHAQVLKVSDITDSLNRTHPGVKMFHQEIRSLQEAAKGARSWMPPEFGTGLWMVPYNPSLWKKGDMGEPGMGQFMISAQQMFPSKKKQDADARYMESMTAMETENLNASLNEWLSEGRQNYSEWIVLEKKLSVIHRNEKLLELMLKTAEIRYRNGLGKMGAYYKTKAAVGSMQNMKLMFENEIRSKQIRLNTLMGRKADDYLEIDTSLALKEFSGMQFDSSFFYARRSDLRALDKQMNSLYLKQETETQSLRPQFGLKYDHMFGFGGMPMQFSLMAMIKIPMAKWSSKMNKANLESLKWKAASLHSQKEMMAREYTGMAYGMRNELALKKQQLNLYNNDILPALRNNFKSMLLAYEQNTEELFMLYDAWELLYKAELEYADITGQAIRIQNDLERLIESK